MSNAAIFAAGLATIVTSDEFIPELSIDLIDLLDNARSDLGDMAELTASVAKDGVQQPVIVYREGDRFVLWMGHRRLKATQLAGKTTLPAIVKAKPTPQEFLAMQVVENLIRESMSDQDIFSACVRLEAMGMKRGEVAVALGKSPGQTSKYFAPLNCLPEIQALFFAGKITLGQSYQISKSPEQMVTANLLMGGATRTQAKTRGKSSKATTEREERLVIHMLNAGVIVKSRKGQTPLSLVDVQQLLKDATAKVDRALDQGLGIKAAALGWADTQHNPVKPRKRRQPKTN